MSDTYIPDEQDLMDFEEFAKERESNCKYVEIDRYSTRPVSVRMYPWSCSRTYGEFTNEPQWYTRGTIVEYLKCMTSCILAANCSKKEMLVNLSLFCRDEATLLQEVKNIVGEDLTDEEFMYIINDTQPERPYLTQRWNAIFGIPGLQNYQEQVKRLSSEHVLPYSVFDMDSIDFETEYTRLELIRNQPIGQRPLYCYRHVGLAGQVRTSEDYVYNPLSTEDDIVEVDFSDFITRILNFRKTLTTAFRWQFGMTFTYINPKNTLQVTVLSKFVMDKLESYFNVKFTGSQLCRRRWNYGTVYVVRIPNWFDRTVDAPKVSKSGISTRYVRKGFEPMNFPHKSEVHADPEVVKYLKYINRIIDAVNGESITLAGALSELGIPKEYYSALHSAITNTSQIPQHRTAKRLNEMFDKLFGSSK